MRFSYPSVTEDPILIAEENWTHGLDHVSSTSTSLDFEVLNGAVTKLGETLYLTIGMAIMAGWLAWNLCASSGWPARAKLRHWGGRFEGDATDTATKSLYFTGSPYCQREILDFMIPLCGRFLRRILFESVAPYAYAPLCKKPGMGIPPRIIPPAAPGSHQLKAFQVGILGE